VCYALHAHTHTHTHTHTCTRTRTCMHTHMHMHTHACTRTHTHHTCIRMDECSYMYATVSTYSDLKKFEVRLIFPPTLTFQLISYLVCCQTMVMRQASWHELVAFVVHFVSCDSHTVQASCNTDSPSVPHTMAFTIVPGLYFSNLTVRSGVSSLVLDPLLMASNGTRPPNHML
jgi:hypothetical protein